MASAIEDIQEVIDILEREYPESEVSLDYHNTYELLVATMLSAQTTDKMVNSVTPELFSNYPDPQSLADASQDEVISYIKSIGLYNRKSKNLIRMANKLIDDYDGKVPRTMKGLISLPGVGRKTANVIMGNAFGIEDSGITVDTHVKRISKRLGLTNQTTAKKVEQDLMKIIPEDYWVDITHLMISHGREICKARKPKCDECPLTEYCRSAFDFDHFI